MAKEVSFLDSPFAFEWIDCKAMGFQIMECHVNEFEMFFPCHVGEFDIIDVSHGIMFRNFHTEGVLHGSLGPVRGLTNSHRKDVAMELAKGCDNGAQFLRFLVKVEGVVLHGDVKFGEELVRFLVLDNGLNARQWTFVSVNCLI